MADLSKWSTDVFEYYPLGAQCLSLENVPAMVADLEQMVSHKSKGKMQNVNDVLTYMGVQGVLKTKEEIQADGSIKEVEYYDPDSFVQYDKTLATREDIMNTEMATAIKSGGTPFAGMFSIAGMATCRNLGVVASKDDPSVVVSDAGIAKNLLDLTYNATQAALQAKHDAIMAIQRFSVLQGPLKAMWDSRPVEKVSVFDKKLGRDVTKWVEVKSKEHLTTKQWFDQFMALHNDPDGMNLEGDVNPEQVGMVARALTDPKTGKVYSIGSKEAFKALSSPMDELGYYPSFERTVEMAKANENLFRGPVSRHLAPNAIKEAKGFVPSDVRKKDKMTEKKVYQGNRAQNVKNKDGIHVTVSNRGMRTDETKARIAASQREVPVPSVPAEANPADRGRNTVPIMPANSTSDIPDFRG